MNTFPHKCPHYNDLQHFGEFNNFYKNALRAEMGITNDVEYDMFDDYYDLDSDIVQGQAAAHGTY